MKNQAFTIIELLIAVLIIGILAAIAVPQYQKSVEKSKAMQVLPILNSFFHAQEAYFLANGNYAAKFDYLDVNLPWTGRKQFNYTWSTDFKSSNDWSLEIANENNSLITVDLGRISGKYSGAGFMYIFKHPSKSNYKNKAILEKLLCIERIGMIHHPFTGAPGSYCEKIFNATPVQSFSPSEIRLYTMPL